jgi:hypothetical protein
MIFHSERKLTSGIVVKLQIHVFSSPNTFRTGNVKSCESNPAHYGQVTQISMVCVILHSMSDTLADITTQVYWQLEETCSCLQIIMNRGNLQLRALDTTRTHNNVTSRTQHKHTTILPVLLLSSQVK